MEDLFDMAARACSLARREDSAAVGDTMLVAADMPFGTAGTTNFLHIAKV